MNFFLYLNRKILLILSLAIFILFATLIYVKQILSIKDIVEEKNSNLPNVDIEEPRFAINNNKKNSRFCHLPVSYLAGVLDVH